MERCIRCIDYFFIPLSSETSKPNPYFQRPPFPIPPGLAPLDSHHGKISDSMMIHQNQGDWKINIKPWKPITYRNCIFSTECILIDIIVTSSIAVGNGCSLRHSEFDTNSHLIKTCNRLTTISIIYVDYLINSCLMTDFTNAMKPHVQTKTRNNTCIIQTKVCNL